MLLLSAAAAAAPSKAVVPPHPLSNGVLIDAHRHEAARIRWPPSILPGNRSEKEPARDPLLLWLQGGPGCSGLSGLVYEIALNFYFCITSQVSNIIFVDSPVGSGFSYATKEEGFHSSDTIAIKQLVIFLDKGYIAGNPMTDKQFDTDGKYKFFHGMGLIPDELYEGAKESCEGRYYQPANHQCAEYIEYIDNCTKDINEFHILEPSCEVLWRQMAEKDEMRRLMLLESSVDDLPLLPFKCRHDSYELLFIWENDEAVRKTLGVRQDTVGEWRRCNPSIPYKKDIPSTVEHHLRLHKAGYQSMIYRLAMVLTGTRMDLQYIHYVHLLQVLGIPSQAP
ncbi:Serine carboxypeptidase-like 19 [Dichanthelium oligosanthes]|uniref:Serine carboxypeptidase-like 19 n=1 Tax=Dichanthelium oligosanthes TaxID=888268 RepID=A0A1E5VJK1_9POAL|nr:Serine carboxypeptidase-like 19 [Dichanthelium oligosanthes]